MENQYQKWVNLSYLGAAILLGYVVFVLGFKLAGAYDLETRVRNVEFVIRGLSVLAGALLFFVLWRHERVNVFMNEVVSELAKVTWPTPKETSNATVVVIIMVVASGMILGLLDYIWTYLLKFIL